MNIVYNICLYYVIEIENIKMLFCGVIRKII